jgi:hypothetical protein
MMQNGDIVLSFTDDGQGGWQVSTDFYPAGGGDPLHLDGPTPVNLGQSVTITQTCVECDLATTVSVGSAEGRPAPAPAPARSGPSRPMMAPAKPGRGAAGGPHGPHGR